MGSISGLISILLLVDLCTCRISGQNKKKIKNLKIIYSKRFLVYIVLDQQVLWRRCRGLDNSPLVIVSSNLYICFGQSTSFMAPLPGIERI